MSRVTVGQFFNEPGVSKEKPQLNKIILGDLDLYV